MSTLEEANSLGFIFVTCHQQRKRDSNRLTFEHVEHGIISDIIEQRCAVSPSSSLPPTRSPSIVDVNLHPSALALDGDYRDTTVPIMQALHMVKNADAIIFGYDSTGIPKGLGPDPEQVLNQRGRCYVHYFECPSWGRGMLLVSMHRRSKHKTFLAKLIYIICERAQCDCYTSLYQV